MRHCYTLYAHRRAQICWWQEMALDTLWLSGSRQLLRGNLSALGCWLNWPELSRSDSGKYPKICYFCTFQCICWVIVLLFSCHAVVKMTYQWGSWGCLASSDVSWKLDPSAYLMFCCYAVLVCIACTSCLICQLFLLGECM